MSISARHARVMSVAQTRAATRMLDIVTLTLITFTFTLTPPLALLILLFDVPSEHTRVLRNAPADLLRKIGRHPPRACVTCAWLLVEEATEVSTNSVRILAALLLLLLYLLLLLLFFPPVRSFSFVGAAEVEGTIVENTRAQILMESRFVNLQHRT